MLLRMFRIGWLLGIVALIGACSSASYVRTDKRPNSSASRSSVVTNKPAISGPSYRVVKGDTLYGIAFRNGLDFRDLASWNGIASPYTIYVGQMLKLGSAGRVVASTTTTQSTPPRQSSPSVTPSTAASSSTAPKPQVSTTTPANTAAAPATSPAPVAQPPSVASNGSVSFRWPLEGPLLGRYASGDPARAGIDIGAKAGTQVRAAADGDVVYSGNGLVLYGELIIIKHTNSLLSAYARNGRRLVEEGAHVKAGQPIAEIGTSRQQLHFEIRRDGKPVNPLDYLPKR